ncbi:MAG TPA: glycosyltransferase, partial [Gemmatimonadales bacterium]|nr:glycosyltransferase [Gemmatimonadales bacterium]
MRPAEQGTKRAESSLTILYFGTDWEGANRTSSHHVARWLARHHRLEFFECPGLRPPALGGGDGSRLKAKLRLMLSGARRPEPGVTVRTLFQIPFHGSRLARWLNRILLRWQAGRVARSVRRRDPDTPIVSWFIAPHVGSLAGRLGEDLSVYYCVDDFAAFPGVDAVAVQQMDDTLTAAADLVFVSSDTLLDAKRRLGSDVHHAPHGVDLEHFRNAARNTGPRPAAIPADGPVIGYFGLIAPWIDLDLIDELAMRHPEWRFVMIGRIAVESDALPRRDNVSLPGPVEYQRLPELAAWFDVAVIPYRLTRQVMHANPIKLREYIALEHPVVAVSTPEIDKFAGLVAIADGPDQWERAIEVALSESPESAEFRSRTQARAAEE